MFKKTLILWLLNLIVFGICLTFLFVAVNIGRLTDFTPLVLIFSLVLSLQNVFTLIWMLYGWASPESEGEIGSPKKFLPPKLSFTALVPARHEAKVIADTIISLSNMDYPENFAEILVLCRQDDVHTIAKVEETIAKLKKENIRLIIFDDDPINKPHALNIGLKEANGEIITVFDAEDEPHPAIYKMVNTLILNEGVDVVQSGVQLMNHRSHWFSTLNVLEYYFWFKSGLHFFSRVGEVAPLGGNTVFFKKNWLNKVGGWDEGCLTEDADIGIRLVSAGAKIRVVYEDSYVTKEETPHNIESFVKQRTRWNQGFIQVLVKGDWLNLPFFKQKIISLYILLSPIIQGLILVYIPLGILIALTKKLPLPLAIISYTPFYLMFIQLFCYVVGLYKFTKEHNKYFSFDLILKIIITYYPYQFLLACASFRAIFRQVFGHSSWEKTHHFNIHRNFEISQPK